MVINFDMDELGHKIAEGVPKSAKILKFSSKWAIFRTEMPLWRGSYCNRWHYAWYSCSTARELSIEHHIAPRVSSMTGIRYEILARRPKNREKRDFGKLKFLKAQGLGARFLPLRGLGAILGTPGWNCNVVCTKFVVLWRNCLWKAVDGSGG